MSINPEVVLCATRRLSRNLKIQRVLDQAEGRGAIPVLNTLTIEQWLDRVTEEALLSGELPLEPNFPRVLSLQQEELLWRKCIEKSLGQGKSRELFDLDGLASAAMQANELVVYWGIDLAPHGTAEARRFLEWRKTFQIACVEGKWRDRARHLVWQLEQIKKPALTLPPAIAFAGFDSWNPQELKLKSLLTERGVDVSDWAMPEHPTPEVGLTFADDPGSELRMITHWVKDLQRQRPEARIGVVIPDLTARRAEVIRLFDEALDVPGFRPAESQRQRSYNVSMGVPLVQVPIVRAALSLLSIARAGRRIPQVEMGSLLTGAYWAADVTEMGGRARLDALLRDALPVGVTLDQVIRVARKGIVNQLPVKETTNRLQYLKKISDELPRRQLPSKWGGSFSQVLESVAWPGERPLSSHDYQAREGFSECIAGLVELDEILGQVDIDEAIFLVRKAAQESVFQAETEGRPKIQVLGLLEAAGERFDALWVSGMNDHVWPPPVRPNPLIPASIQRDLKCPNGSPEVQSAFAAAIYRRLRSAAPEVVFSCPKKDGDRELRASPLLAAEKPLPSNPPAEPAYIAAQVSAIAEQGSPIESIRDDRGPAVEDADNVRGGTGLIRMQAICPAWAFFEHRLGARELEEPTEGMDARGRGTVVHACLEHFWKDRSLDAVKALDEPELLSAIQAAVCAGLDQFDAESVEPLPKGFRVLESDRLEKLLGRWVALELTRSTGFLVVAREAEHRIDVCGIKAKVVVDRVDQLPDGSLLVLDYKTAKKVDATTWCSDRITEPQLPIYAAFALKGQPVAGIAFAQTLLDDPKFSGVTRDDGVLPGVPGLESARKKGWDEARFPDWESVLAHWERALSLVVEEIKTGAAGITFSDENDLRYCGVKPILRLAERRQQYEDALAKRNEMIGGGE